MKKLHHTTVTSRELTARLVSTAQSWPQPLNLLLPPLQTSVGIGVSVAAP